MEVAGLRGIFGYTLAAELSANYNHTGLFCHVQSAIRGIRRPFKKSLLL
jgi:hypothetical protein